MSMEERRLEEARAGQVPWRRWGPYLSERCWGTVREDYSPDGTAWEYFPHDHARSRVYRWGEDGLGGICDERQALCLAFSLWNGHDPILKERLFGLTGNQGNHGEDVKEYYWFLDNVPSHSSMRFLYKYPQAAFPYQQLLDENRRRGRDAPEFELIDTGVFEGNRYFDMEVEYAKADAEDLLIEVRITNRGPEAAECHLLPTLWFRNTWAWGYSDRKPSVSAAAGTDHPVIVATHHRLGTYRLHCETAAELLFTENETNFERLFPGTGNPSRYVKDAFHERVIDGRPDAVNPGRTGTKACAWYRFTIAPLATQRVRLRLRAEAAERAKPFGAGFDRVLADRRRDADEFHSALGGPSLSDDERLVLRQAVAGMLWAKQFYDYDVYKWLLGDPEQPPPPPERWKGRNHQWTHLNNADILSMPDTWEYPWYASWDLAFHTIVFAMFDPDFAKNQLITLLREWYMHPNGQVPAYEWAFGDVNPPVHAWAALRIYQIDRKHTGHGDTDFLERVFHKLLINFTWWINRKDAEGRNLFQGGFLGLDNIGAFDRGAALPGNGRLDQSDGTSWMAMYCLNMLAIALELAGQDPTYEDVATKFLEHFFYIAHAMNDRPAAQGDDGVDLWDDQDGFYYDVLHVRDESYVMRVRSMVGLLPLLAIETLEPALLARLPGFRSRLEWFLSHRPDLVANVAPVTRPGREGRFLLAIVTPDRLRDLLTRMLDESEFLSPFGVRSVSRYHAEHPFRITIDGMTYEEGYQPAESRTELFGGNSNWRGPVWFPLNYLIIEALQKWDWYYGRDFTVPFPAPKGDVLPLGDVARELSRRLIRIFLRDSSGRRPVYGDYELFQRGPEFRDLILFHEYFHGDTGAGLGASHQTGWTGLVAKLIQQSGGGDA
ncbi:MAG TPA: hypothetical protein VMG41_15305 [Gemmatimonadales bacterium]|nr:hypothetical protein [Gemmatimonadales bacterium]